jgi:glucose/arabinose dehydrogenase/N-acetylneuraminic acid mutarotase
MTAAADRGAPVHHCGREGLVRVLLATLIAAAWLGAAAGPAAGQTTCTPLPCSEIKVALPYQLTFDRDHGKIRAGNGTGTGFTTLLRPAGGNGYDPPKLAVAGGTLRVTTTPGIAYLGANAQANALGVGFAAPNQTTAIRTSIVNAPAGTGKNEQAGLYFGSDQDNYVKLVLLSSAAGTRVELLMEIDGQRMAGFSSAPVQAAGATVALTLVADPTDRSVRGSFSVGAAAPTSVGTVTAPGELFSFDGAGIDPAIGTRSFAGIMATHRSATQPLVYQFGDFSLTAQSGAGGGGGGGGGGPVDFSRTSFPVPFPTSIAAGPDGRVYVTEVGGKIHAVTLDAAKRKLADQVITALGSRLALGITVDPRSTPGNVVLWVAHSSPSQDAGEANSSTVTRLSGAGFTQRHDVITGLPRAIANHAINSIHFGPDDRLYIAIGGNTGAGAHNNANTEFGTMQEQPLSAAILVADVRRAGFDGSCAAGQLLGSPPCDVATYATGFRNAYDFAWHSNGSMYAADNGLGVVGTFPPSPTPPCFGMGSTTSWKQGGENPGAQPDTLHRIVPGGYHGHPNPSRSECVFGDGSFQGVAPLPRYQRPIYNLGANRSSNGIVEYCSNAFGGALQGELLIANYSVGDDITRVRLAADGRSVASATRLAAGFSDPLPLATLADGTIFVGETAANRVTALVPTQPGSACSAAPGGGLGAWSARKPLPGPVLDAGGAALGGKLYVVAGKTSSQGHRTAAYAYDPATDAWTRIADLPGKAVENPAVVASGGRLYAFGGSTAPFSGAQASAAVYDPAANRWSPLPALATARGGAGAVAVAGKIYVAGGMGADGASLASVEVFNTATGTWGSAPAMSVRRDNPGVAELAGAVYVFGGRTRNADGTTANGTLKSVARFDPATGAWSDRAAMPTGRRAVAVGTLRGRAQIIGGEAAASGAAFEQNEEYDPVTNSWRTLQAVPTARHGAAAGTVGDVVHVVGGSGKASETITAVNEAFSFPAGGPPGGSAGGGAGGSGGTPAGGAPRGGGVLSPRFPDGIRPRVKGMRVRGIRRGVRVRFWLSEPARVVVRIRSAAGRRGRAVVTVRLPVARRGTHRLKIVDRRIRRRRYVVEVRAIDAGGNRSLVRRRDFRAR